MSKSNVAIVKDFMGMHDNVAGSVTSQSSNPNDNAIEINPKRIRIVQVDVTNSFLFEMLLGNSQQTSTVDWAIESVDEDVSKLSEQDSCIEESVFEGLLRF